MVKSVAIWKMVHGFSGELRRVTALDMEVSEMDDLTIAPGGCTGPCSWRKVEVVHIGTDIHRLRKMKVEGFEELSVVLPGPENYPIDELLAVLALRKEFKPKRRYTKRKARHGA